MPGGSSTINATFFKHLSLKWLIAISSEPQKSQETTYTVTTETQTNSTKEILRYIN